MLNSIKKYKKEEKDHLKKSEILENFIISTLKSVKSSDWDNKRRKTLKRKKNWSFLYLFFITFVGIKFYFSENLLFLPSYFIQ